MAESDKKYTASGRKFIVVRVFFKGNMGEERGVRQKVEVFRFGTHNIQNIRNGDLGLECRDMT